MVSDRLCLIDRYHLALSDLEYVADLFESVVALPLAECCSFRWRADKLVLSWAADSEKSLQGQG